MSGIPKRPKPSQCPEEGRDEEEESDATLAQHRRGVEGGGFPFPHSQVVARDDGVMQKHAEG